MGSVRRVMDVEARQCMTGMHSLCGRPAGSRCTTMTQNPLAMQCPYTTGNQKKPELDYRLKFRKCAWDATSTSLRSLWQRPSSDEDELFLDMSAAAKAPAAECQSDTCCLVGKCEGRALTEVPGLSE